MTKTLILYGSSRRWTAAHKRVSYPSQPDYFVRVETSPFNLLEALDKAKPRPGEVVLNTVDSNSEPEP